MSAPDPVKIYHITHVDNLARIIEADRIYSDAEMVRMGKDHASIGMAKLKTGRFERPVPCHVDTMVSDYVPFYFCPRSPMLYIAYRQNHGEMTYKGGQEAIIHLEADFGRMAAAADRNNVQWAVSLSNAAARYAEFRTGSRALEELDWECINARQWQPSNVKERKQAECLFHNHFPWWGITRLGVKTTTVHQRVRTLLERAEHRPPVELRPEWYY